MQFAGRIEKVMGEGGWHVIVLPSEVTQQLRNEAGKKGNVPVVVKIGNTTYPTTIMSMGQQRWFFAVKADVRRTENLIDGDKVSVTIKPDVERLG